MRLRTGGLVPFGAPMERAGLLSRWMYGRAYRQSVPAASPSGGIDQWLRWFWWPWRSGRSGGGRDGVDGEGESGLHGGEEGRRRCEDDDDGVGVALRPRKSPPGAVVPNRASNKPLEHISSLSLVEIFSLFSLVVAVVGSDPLTPISIHLIFPSRGAESIYAHTRTAGTRSCATGPRCSAYPDPYATSRVCAANPAYPFTCSTTRAHGDARPIPRCRTRSPI